MRLQTYIDRSIALLQRAEKIALRMSDKGFYLAFSGGKDSQVLYHLAQEAGVRFEAHDVADTTGDRSQARHTIGASAIGREIVGFDRFPAQSPLCRGDDGLPYRLDADAVLATVRGRDHFAVWRRESIKAYGNAIVPQVAHQIFKIINQYENRTC